MRILGLERDNKACNYYRVMLPLLKLKEHGLADACLVEYGTDIAGEENYQKVLESDVVLIPRPQSEEWLDFIKAVRQAGKVVIADYDDNPFECSPYNPYYRFTGIKEYEVQWPDGHKETLWKDGMKGPNGEKFFDIEANIHRRDMCRASFGKADLVTCTVEPLAKEFRKINPHVEILPNLMDFSAYPKVEMAPNKKPRIGWQGGVSHFEDLKFIKPVLEKVASRSDLDFIYYGDRRLGNMFLEIPGYQHQEWVPINVYPYKLACQNFDIGLAPLVDNLFNRCKSAIKYFEYSMVGVPTIASNIPPYSDVISNEVDGILVDSENEWIEAIQRLLDNPALRKRIASNAYENVYQNYNADKSAHLWIKAYESALKRDTVQVI